MRHGDPILFALGGAQELGASIAACLGIPLTEYDLVEFDDGEHKMRAAADVEGRDVYVIESLYRDEDRSIHDKLCRLLFFLGSLRDASAARLTAVIPYLCYARVDRKTQPNDPVTNRYIAMLLESVGVDHVVALDVHNLAAFENAYRCPTHHLEARPRFVEHFAPLLESGDPLVLSPDAGGIKRAEQFREALATALGKPVASAFMEKRRKDERVTGERVVGEVKGRTAVIFDDMICSGRTLSRAIRACSRQGAETVYAAATHAVFTQDAEAVINDPGLSATVVTDSIPLSRTMPGINLRKIVTLSAGDLIAAAIRRIHAGGSAGAIHTGS